MLVPEERGVCQGGWEAVFLGARREAVTVPGPGASRSRAADVD